MTSLCDVIALAIRRLLATPVYLGRAEHCTCRGPRLDIKLCTTTDALAKLSFNSYKKYNISG
jgi:hypothetical protein